MYQNVYACSCTLSILLTTKISKFPHKNKAVYTWMNITQHKTLFIYRVSFQGIQYIATCIGSIVEHRTPKVAILFLE